MFFPGHSSSFSRTLFPISCSERLFPSLCETVALTRVGSGQTAGGTEGKASEMIDQRVLGACYMTRDPEKTMLCVV